MPSRFDFERDVLVFLRVPKTGSSSLTRMLVRAIGPRHCALLPDRHVDGLDYGLKRAHDQVRRFGTRAVARMYTQIGTALGYRNHVANAHFLHWHHPLWAPIPTRRRRQNIIVLREPIDRFLSLYFYYRAKAQKRMASSLSQEKRLVADEGVNEGVRRILKSANLRRLNSHCIYLARSASFQDATRAMASEILMAAALEDLEYLNASAAHYLGVPASAVVHRNAGTIRPRQNPLLPETEALLRSALEPDCRLFDYVRENRTRLLRY